MIDIMIIFMILVMYKIKGFGDAHMKVSREQVAEHRLQILAAAARLFRLRGFEGVPVAEVMKGRRSDAWRLLWILSIQGGAHRRGCWTRFAPGSR
jgi:hypothetical protein